jgi:ABC-type branched-subunit amino acid transport system ATPase component
MAEPEAPHPRRALARPVSRSIVEDDVRDWCARHRMRRASPCVLVEQNVAVSLKLADTAYVLENGRVTLSGTGADLLADDRVRQAYLGL